MRYLAHILLALVVQAAGQSVVFEGKPRSEWMPLLVLVPYALVAGAHRLGVRGKFRWANLLARLAHFSGVIAYAIAVLFCGWIEVVRGWSGQALEFDAWPEWGLFLTFAPFVIYQLANLHAESVAMQSRGARMWRSLRFQVRMFAFALVPFALYLVISVAFARSDTLRVHIESVRLVEGVYLGFLFLVFGTLMPVLLSNTWETGPLPPGQARDLFEAVAKRADFSVRDVLLWNTGDTMANAAIVGISRRSRVVLLSDSLLAMLGPRELACVYGHEIGHSKRHHVAIFLGWAVFFLLGGTMLSNVVFPNNEWAAMGCVAFSMGLWYVCFGWTSRRLELEADLYSMQLTQDPEALIQALERVAGGARHRGGWRHFSTARRVQFLHRAAFDEVFKLRFQRRIALIGRTGLVLGALVSLVYLVSMWKSLDSDRLGARLALGSYEAEWVAEVPDVKASEGLLELLPLAGELANEDGSRVPIERLESALKDSLEMGSFEEAFGWARLLGYREHGDGRLLSHLMSDLDLPPAPDAGLEDWPLPWREYALEGLALPETGK